MNKVFKTCFASVVSELQQSDIYMTVKARLFEAPKANLNGASVTIGFLDEIVANEEKYVGLPLCADIKNLTNGHYERLGHLYDARTGEFHSTQIGSFYKYEKEEFDGGAYLVGYARVMKRNKAVCKALAELFASGSLKFSFEISCGSYKKMSDGTIEIDAADDNFLEGAAVVTFPACEDAVALELVAECTGITDETKEGESTMTDVNESAEVVAEEEQTEEAVTETAEQVEAEKTEEVTETETAEVESAEQENAEVVVRVETCETETVSVYDTDTGEETRDTMTLYHEERAIVSETEPAVQTEVAEEEPQKEEEEKEEVEEEASCKKKDENAELIAKLIASIEDLKKEIAEMKEARDEKIIAEAVETAAAENPFMSSLNSAFKYSLLESSTPVSSNSYSLLEKA